MLQIDYTAKVLRASAILTNAYVAGTVLGVNPPVTASDPMPRYFNQLVLYIAFTLGSLTSLQVKVEFSPDNGVTWYQESVGSIGTIGSPTTETDGVLEHSFSATGNYRLPVNIADDQIRVSVKGTGTVAGSAVAITAALIKNFA